MEVSYKRNDRIIRRKFYQYLIPTVLMVMAMQFGSLVEAILIGNLIGPDALSASSLGLPVVFLVELPGIAIGTGASIVASNFIGKRRIEDASKVFKISLVSVFLISLLLIPVGIFASDGIATLFSGNFPSLIPMVSQYIRVYFCQAAILNVGILIAYFLPSDNSPTLGALYFIISNIVHILALVLFAFIPGWTAELKMMGAGLSMGIGMLSGMVVIIPYIKSKRRMVDLKASLKGSMHFMKDILRAGSTAAAMDVLSFVFYLVLNFAAVAFLTEQEMPAYAMLSNTSFAVDLFILGPLQLMSSVIPALFGEKDFFGLKSICRRVIILVSSITAILTILSLVFPQFFFFVFNVNLDEVVAGSKVDPLLAVRIYALCFIIYAANKFFMYYYPAILVNSPGVVNNVARLGLIGPVLIYFLMKADGVMGFAYGNVILEAATFLTVVAFVLIGKKLRRFEGKGLFLIPYIDPKAKRLDISLPAKSDEISKCVEELQRFGEEISQDPKASGMLALAAEEIMVNTLAYGYQRKSKIEYIDLCLTQTEKGFLLRIRDDGISFDPTIYKVGEDDESAYHGIEIVRKVAKEFRYLRVLNTNNTIIEISK